MNARIVDENVELSKSRETIADRLAACGRGDVAGEALRLDALGAERLHGLFALCLVAHPEHDLDAELAELASRFEAQPPRGAGDERDLCRRWIAHGAPSSYIVYCSLQMWRRPATVKKR
jgi:hypothetical protein